MFRISNKILIRLNCLIYFFSLNTNTVYGQPTIVTKHGTLLGSTMYSRLGKSIDAYQGIPYAAPPVGELRFKPPQPTSAWNGKRLAVDSPSLCTQSNIFLHMKGVFGDEDCLYLNVYTPTLTSTEKQTSFIRYPVMVWFHGGGWISGGGHQFQPDYLLDHKVVLVTVNYRLGPLGFLSTEDLECPGNLGLKDQKMALQWVQENILFFHGNAENVTIFGESSGGVSVHYHMVSPLSRGLFHRAISQSGTFYSPWTFRPPGSAKKKAETLATHLNCTTESSKKLLECLRTKSAKEITNTNEIFQEFSYCPLIPFRPVIEPEHPDAFLTEDPIISMQEGRIADIPWITGINSEEGAMITPFIYGQHLVKKLNDEFTKIAPLILLYDEKYQLVDKNFIDEITDTIRTYYFGQNDIDESDTMRFNVTYMLSDALFNHATYMAARDFIAKQASPLYYYYFAYRGSTSFSAMFGDYSKNYGVAHADDLQYLFPVTKNLVTSKLSENDEYMVELLTTLWCNFAIFGNPTPEITELIPVQWKSPVPDRSLEYLHIVDKQNVFMKSELLTDRMSFWDRLENRIKSSGKSGRAL